VVYYNNERRERPLTESDNAGEHLKNEDSESFLKKVLDFQRIFRYTISIESERPNDVKLTKRLSHPAR